MDEFVSNTLDSWGMAELKDSFESQGIDKSVFEDLDDNAIKELIPKLGVRIKFKKKYGDLYARKENRYSDDEAGSESFMSTDGPLSESQYAINESTLATPTTSQIRNCGSLRMLKKTLIGTEILHIYKKQNCLTDGLRAKLVDCIITEELKKSDSKLISSDRFIELRDELRIFFPTENKSLYYVPYESDNNGQVYLAKGKLYSKYYNTRRTLKKLGIIKRKISQVETTEVSDVPVDYQPSEEELEKIEWLKNSHEPWDKILEYWNFTYSARASQYTDDITIYDYYKRFPALKQDKGYILLENDFSKKFPGKELNLFSNWPSYRKKLILYAKTRNKIGCQNCLDILTICDTEETRTVVALRLIPLLVPVVSSHKKKRTSYRSTNTEMQESFLTRINTVSDLQPVIEKRTEKLRRCGLPVQPFVIIVGQSLQKIDASYVVIDDVFYLLETPLKAVDVCFKACFALFALYTAWSERAWLFSQKAVYKIDTSWDSDRRIPSGLLAFLTDIENQRVFES